MECTISTVLINKKVKIIYSSTLLFLTIFILSTIGCECPAGAEGPPGSEGKAGPVGPAGENGSVMHAGEGVPEAEIGAVGDYYLDKSTGELYGPKTEEGWGTPIQLAGEDGSDGEDGSQIFAGTTAPDESLGILLE